jgi:hypothetical protein
VPRAAVVPPARHPLPGELWNLGRSEPHGTDSPPTPHHQAPSVSGGKQDGPTGTGVRDRRSSVPSRRTYENSRSSAIE